MAKLIILTTLSTFVQVSEAANFIDVCPKDVSITTIINSDPITDTGVKAIVFSVQSCHGAVVTLASDPSFSEPWYRIMIGILNQWTDPPFFTNIYTILCSDKVFPCENRTWSEDAALDCSSPKNFWVSWNDSISLGRGQDVLSNTILSANLLDGFKTDFIAIESSNEESLDQWRIKLDEDSFKLSNAVRCGGTSFDFTTNNIDGFISTKTYPTTSSSTRKQTIKGSLIEITSINNRTSETTSPMRSSTNSSNGIISTPQATPVSGYSYFSSTENSRMTTNDNTNNSTNNLQCCCVMPLLNRWAYLKDMNLTKEQLRLELNEHLTSLRNSILIDRKQTRKFITTKISAPDERVSSRSIGWMAAFIISLVPGSVVIIDICGCMKAKTNMKS